MFVNNVNRIGGKPIKVGEKARKDQEEVQGEDDIPTKYERGKSQNSLGFQIKGLYCRGSFVWVFGF